MSAPSTVRRRARGLIALLFGAGGLSALAAIAQALADTIPPLPAWAWALLLLVALLALVFVLALAVLRACWPSQSAHRMELIKALTRRSAP
ncbi:hypothetical protein ACOQFV_24040 [Nocardiopsis changdeensis]|uniref:Uncharacterized protein n=1 Tax=Nocardiopsis changdeensis TaxID=2831969 RepID=A0A975KQL0_9ACTN|nr:MULTISPECIES: hypothetical protein [Nocardiopsis]QUX26534.1 hypothetical protein KGD84_33080 [Nocardiopsis changdeensis]QYX40653.1 hypothetical protein K1J57_32150 [Nocardiopsis sp. MT53]